MLSFKCLRSLCYEFASKMSLVFRKNGILIFHESNSNIVCMLLYSIAIKQNSYHSVLRTFLSRRSHCCQSATTHAGQLPNRGRQWYGILYIWLHTNSLKCWKYFFETWAHAEQATVIANSDMRLDFCTEVRGRGRIKSHTGPEASLLFVQLSAYCSFISRTLGRSRLTFVRGP